MERKTGEEHVPKKGAKTGLFLAMKSWERKFESQWIWFVLLRTSMHRYRWYGCALSGGADDRWHARPC